MVLFDSNQWYQLTLPLFGQKSMLGLQPNSKNAATVFFQDSNTSSANQRWQVFATDKDKYILRSKSSSPDAYLAVQQNRKSTDANSGSTAIMRRVQGASEEVFWNIQLRKNGGYTLINVSNGTNWHLHAENASSVQMTQDIGGDINSQKFIFTGLGQINDAAFSTIELPSGATATAGAAGTAQTQTDGGLSGGAKAAIGASIGSVVLIAIIVGILFLLRRRRKKQPTHEAPNTHEKAELDAGFSPYDATEPSKVTPPTGTYPQELEANGVHEIQSTNPVELPGTTTELPPRHVP